MMTPDVEQIQWHGCYDDSWNGHIVPEAFAHPAKFARGLITRIFKHMLSEGMIVRGSSIVDPFGGIGTGGIVAASYGLQWYGCELEAKFHALAQQNFAMHMHTWMQFDDPAPVLVQGDSRKLRENLRGVLAEAVVCSPPFTESLPSGDTSSSFKDKYPDAKCGGDWGQSYGASAGQLGAMPPGSVDSVVSSPPYAEGLGHGGQPTRGHCRGDDRNLDAMQDGYGNSPGQLSALPVGQVDSVVTSPPYEGSDQDYAGGLKRIDSSKGTHSRIKECTYADASYGDSSGQIGNTAGETFWSAARDIVAECFAILKPGGYSAWVCKDFVRNKARVPFCDDWCKLLESQGFFVTTRVHAMLVKETRDADLFGGEDHVRTKERKSFFRRLAEKKGSPRIDFEEVVFARKP